jgi:hypothetical protein
MKNCCEPRAGLTLVTYDQRTIPALLHRWAESGQCHAGIVFVDERTVAPNDFPLLARSLILFGIFTGIWIGRID